MMIHRRTALKGGVAATAASEVRLPELSHSLCLTPTRTAQPATLGLEAVAAELAAVAQQLVAQAVSVQGGAVSWATTNSGGGSNSPALLGPYIYDGTLGVAMFLSAWFSVTGDKKARQLAIRAVAPLSTKLLQLALNPSRAQHLRLSIGGFAGLGGFLYGFARMAGWLGEESLSDSARAAASLITEDRIVNDDKHDVMSGCAGAALGLLSFARSPWLAGDQAEQAMALARLCGQRLARRFSHWAVAGRDPSGDRPAISGFAHGAAGISNALLRLYEQSGDAQFRDMALEGFAFERGLYDPVLRNWLDPRFNRPLEQAAWCHGAPGMALARVDTSAIVEVPAVQVDLDQALAITQELPDSPRDHLCCGNSGLIEILHVAGQRLRRPDLTQSAWARLERMLTRVRVKGFCFDLRADEPAFDTSLFLGISGVGYTMLRLLYPHRFPCLLLMESL